MKNTLQQYGFTLIELMVVVAIIGILMAAGIVTFTNAQNKSRDAKRMADVNAVAKTLEQYYADNNQYPNSSVNSDAAGWTTLTTVLATYLAGQPLPQDPKVGINAHRYAVRSTDRASSPDGSSKFCVAAKLENTAQANCTALGTGVFDCPFTTTAPTHFCASSRQ